MKEIVPVPVPQAKILLPERPLTKEINPIPLSSGGVIHPKTGKDVTIGPGGGAYFPKSLLEQFRFNTSLWTYYADEVEREQKAYNARIEENNKKIAEIPLAKPAKKSSWWPF